MIISNRKLSIGVFLFGGAILLVLLAVALLLFLQKKPAEEIPTPIAQERVVIHPDKAFGLTGIVKAVHVTDSSFVLETVALPYGNVRPEQGQVWLWTVEVQEDTEVMVMITGDESEEEKQELRARAAAEPLFFEDIVIGQHVVVTAKEDIVPQFSLAEKHMQAKKIEIANINYVNE